MAYKTYIFEMKQDEYWYGPEVNSWVMYPLHRGSTYEVDVNHYKGVNQVNPLLVSSKGRAIWCEEGFKLKVAEGKIEIQSYKGEVQLYEFGTTLKEAFKGIAQKCFAGNGIVPPKDFFVKPQYNTWIELIYNQNQEDILKYATSIVEQNMPVGIIMIDDSWSEYYGRWRFNGARFPNPKAMVDRLHELGFEVMLWCCPFISPDSLEFRQLRDKGYLVKNTKGEVSLKEWWNGYSGVLDLSHPGAVAWMKEQCQYLMDTYGIDGFKFDAGDAMYYSDEDVTYGNVDANKQCELWAQFGLEYPYNEYRACYKMAGTHLVQRLADKSHSWNSNGLSSLIPNQLTQGILGYAYTCPDMIGGGSYTDFLDGSKNLDQELFVRYAQCAALMPMLQFSAAPWRVLSQEKFEACKAAAWLHVKYADYIYALATEASKSVEPIVRYMSYEFPEEGLELIIDQFMLGNKYLVAPVLEKGATAREVSFPTGKWLGDDGVVVEGPCRITVDVPLDRLPIFERMH